MSFNVSNVYVAFVKFERKRIQHGNIIYFVAQCNAWYINIHCELLFKMKSQQDEERLLSFGIYAGEKSRFSYF